MIGYKVAKNGDTRVIVTIEIPEDALTNMGRSSIAVRETAKYRANKAKVIAIEDDSGTPYASATSFNYEKKTLTYKVGETIEEPSYDPDPEEVCAEGIHYFLTRRVAELYNLSTVENGVIQRWESNGQKYAEENFANGKLHGLCQSWFDNGLKQAESTYVEGKHHGLAQRWYHHGRMAGQATFVDGKHHGLYRKWHCNGELWEEATFVNGKYHGLYQLWDTSGNKWMEKTYLDGKPNGLSRRWHANGKKAEEVTYVDGEWHGTYTRWSEDGTILEEATYKNGVKV